MSSEQLSWLVVALAQFAIFVLAVIQIRRNPHRLYWISGSVLILVGALIVFASLAWVATGANDKSPIDMRGGWFGFWLGLVTAAETIVLAVLMFANRR
jgi:hypothetical protein